MLLMWKVRYFDTRSREFNDRHLWLDTITLDPVAKAAVELANARRDGGRERDLLQFRRVFSEDRRTPEEMHTAAVRAGGCSMICLRDYFEDEREQEVSLQQIAATLSGNPKVKVLPAGAQHHDVEYSLAEKPPIVADQLTVSQDQLDQLGTFAHDFTELTSAAFYQEGPGTVTGPLSGRSRTIQTAVTPDEITAFVMVFRRLYMDGEAANLIRLCLTDRQASS